jgi:endonuclease/exonuclease/phosphatase family metal-dependent hydrolase
MSRIRIMTLNNFNTIPAEEIEYFSDLWENRSLFNVRTIKRYAPDLIGFQEFEPEHRATYLQELGDYEQYVGHESGEGTAILWKRTRFELLDQGVRWLPRAEVAHLHDLEDAFLMNTAWVKLRCQMSGQTFVFLNTHLNDVSESARQIGTGINLQIVNELDAERALPVIMAGDFNCNPWSPVYRQLLNEGFVDTYRAAGHGDSVESSTFHGFHGKEYFALEWGDQVYWRVDWIMLWPGGQPWQITSCTIVRDAEPPVYVSDHYPVVTEMSMVA